MRSYHICPQDVAQTVSRHARDWHWVDLPDGSVLLSTEFTNDTSQEMFEQHATVEPLPHLFDPTPLEDKHVAKFAHIGVKKGHTTKDLRKLVKAKLHRLM